jgi:hypothetical protein
VGEHLDRCPLGGGLLEEVNRRRHQCVHPWDRRINSQRCTYIRRGNETSQHPYKAIAAYGTGAGPALQAVFKEAIFRCEIPP